MTLWQRLIAWMRGPQPEPVPMEGTMINTPPVNLDLPRGIRNNNPGNIDRDGQQWEGMAADQSSDSRFIVFVSAEYGIRALTELLVNYQRYDGLRTVDAMISHFAPPSENNTGAYQKMVAGRMGISVDQEFDVTDFMLCLPMVTAIIAQENADYAYPVATVTAGMAMAGVVKPASAGVA